MTEIPKKQEDQTWINYLIETMKEKGLDVSLKIDSFEKGELSETIECHFSGKYGKRESNLLVELRYTRDTVNNQDWGDFNNLELVPAWQMITFPDAGDASILFFKHQKIAELIDSSEFIDLEFNSESLEDVFKGMRYKAKGDIGFVSFGMNEEQIEREHNSEDFKAYRQYIIQDISIGEELLYRLVDCIAKDDK